MHYIRKILTITIAIILSANIEMIEVNAEDAYSAKEICNLNEFCLQDGLQGELVEYANVFLKAGEEYEVNAIFLAAVAALESDWGRSALATNKNNLYGWIGSSGYMTFDSYEDCIYHVAKFMSEYYLDPEGEYYHGDKVEDICIHYNGRDEWTERVENIMYQIESLATETTVIEYCSQY